MNRKEKGFIFISVLALMILITSVAMSTAILNMSYAGEVSEDGNRDKIYYIANAGAEMVYGALNNTIQTDGRTIMEQMKNDLTASNYSDTRYKLNERDIEIKVKGEIIGYARVSGNVYKVDAKNSFGKLLYHAFYYKILSKGRLESTSSNSKEVYTLTMIIPVEFPSDPKIYSGDKELPKN